MRMMGLVRVGSNAERKMSQSRDCVSVRLVYNNGKGSDPVWISAVKFGSAQSLDFALDKLTRGTQIFAVLRNIELRTWTGKDGTQRVELGAIIEHYDITASGSERKDEHLTASPHLRTPKNGDEIPF